MYKRQTPGAELVFGSFASLSTNIPSSSNYDPGLGNFNPNPSFDFTAGTCSNSYCHGYFKNGNVSNIVSFTSMSVSYTHLRAHETVLDLVCRLLLEKKK